MTAHLHSSIVPGCYRCDLGRDEEIASLAEDYFDVMLAPGLTRSGTPEGGIDFLRRMYLRDAAANPAAVEQLYAWHARREAADVDSTASHAWNVRDVLISNA